MMSHVDDISVDRFEKILEGASVSIPFCNTWNTCVLSTENQQPGTWFSKVTPFVLSLL